MKQLFIIIVAVIMSTTAIKANKPWYDHLGVPTSKVFPADYEVLKKLPDVQLPYDDVTRYLLQDKSSISYKYNHSAYSYYAKMIVRHNGSDYMIFKRTDKAYTDIYVAALNNGKSYPAILKIYSAKEHAALKRIDYLYHGGTIYLFFTYVYGETVRYDVSRFRLDKDLSRIEATEEEINEYRSVYSQETD